MNYFRCPVGLGNDFRLSTAAGRARDQSYGLARVSVRRTAVIDDGNQDAADASVHQRAGPVPPVLVGPAPLARWPPDADTAILSQQQHRSAALVLTQPGLLQQPEPQLVRIFTVEATAAQLPVYRVHGGGDRVEILPVIVAAVRIPWRGKTWRRTRWRQLRGGIMQPSRPR